MEVWFDAGGGRIKVYLPVLALSGLLESCEMSVFLESASAVPAPGWRGAAPGPPWWACLKLYWLPFFRSILNLFF